MSLKIIKAEIMNSPINKLHIISEKHKRILHIGKTCIGEKYYNYMEGKYDIDNETFIFDSRGKHRNYYYSTNCQKPKKIFEINQTHLSPESLRIVVEQAEMWTMTKDTLRETMALTIGMLPYIVLIIGVIYWLVAGA